MLRDHPCIQLWRVWPRDEPYGIRCFHDDLVLCMLILGECGDGGGMVISCGIFRAILVSNKTLEYAFQTIFKFTTKP